MTIREEVGLHDRRSYDCMECNLELSMARPLWVRLRTRGNPQVQRCFCTTCLRAWDLDLGPPGVCCPKCKRPTLRTPLELVGRKCPRCQNGIIARTGQDK